MEVWVWEVGSLGFDGRAKITVKGAEEEAERNGMGQMRTAD